MKLEFLVIHCTATPEGREVTSDEIRKWHTGPKEKGGRGWKQVGYSDMIHIDGTIENLVKHNDDENVDSWEITNGATGFNSRSRHIVYVGGVKHGKAWDTRTEAQKNALVQYVRETIAKHPDIKVVGHYQMNATSCPAFDVTGWLKSLLVIPEKNIVVGKVK